jgi:hypothetical protein
MEIDRTSNPVFSKRRTRVRRFFFAYNPAMAESSDEVPKPLKLTYADRGSESRWVTLGKFIPLEAQLVAAKLHSEGIPTNLADQNMAQLYSAVIGMDVRVEVLAHDLDHARAVLEEVRATRIKVAQDEPYLEEDWRCSKCRSRLVSFVPLSPGMLILTVLLLGVPLLFITGRKRCANCGHTWQA